ncbi:MAG: 50S ribosomal protein L10 [Alphaproteobacteria bacterium]
MNRTEKTEFVGSLSDQLKAATLVVVTQQSGLTVEESTDLRIKMREADASFRVVKNSLARIAVKDVGLDSVGAYLKGPTALAFSKSPVDAARVAVKYAENNDKLIIIAGMLEGKFLDAHSIKALAKLPSLAELRAKILGVIMAPATKLACTIKEPGSQVARVIASYSKQ